MHYTIDEFVKYTNTTPQGLRWRIKKLKLELKQRKNKQNKLVKVIDEEQADLLMYYREPYFYEYQKKQRKPYFEFAENSVTLYSKLNN